MTVFRDRRVPDIVADDFAPLRSSAVLAAELTPGAIPSPSPPDRGRPRDLLGPAVAALHRCAGDFDHAVRARLHLGTQGYLAIVHVLTSARDIGPTELSELLGITSSACTILVNRLERAGHLQRRPHPTDRRRVHVSVTDATRRIVLAARGTADSAVDEAARHFDADQRAVIHRFLTAAAQSYVDAARRGGAR